MMPSVDETPAQRPVAIEDMALRVAHEIRNPLTSIKLLLQAAAQRSEVGRLDQRQLNVIQQSIARIENTLAELLDYTRPPHPRPCSQDLRESLRRAVCEAEPYADERAVTLAVTVPEAPVTLIADPSQLQQALVNLLMDGIKALGPGNSIRVAMSVVPGPPPAGRITFTQTPRDILPEQIDGLFEPFPVGVGRCAGLALAISRGIVERHGGAITVSSPCVGTVVFTVEIPLVRGCPDY